MVHGKSFGHAANLLVLTAADKFAQRFVVEHGIEFLVVIAKQGAVGKKLVPIGTPDAAKGQQLFLSEMQIEHGAFTLQRSMVRKDGRDVRLVRRFVRREARITIDTVHSFFRRRYVSRSKTGQFFIDARDKFQHWSFDQRFIFLFARLEPVAAVIALERAKKRK